MLRPHDNLSPWRRSRLGPCPSPPRIFQRERLPPGVGPGTPGPAGSVQVGLSLRYLSGLHWRRQGGPRGSSPPIAGQKKLVKTEGLSSLPPAKSGRVCYDNPTGRGHFYQMADMYTCIAYLIEIRKFCSKNLVHKGVNFEAQNALKLTYEHL